VERHVAATILTCDLSTSEIDRKKLIRRFYVSTDPLLPCTGDRVDECAAPSPPKVHIALVKELPCKGLSRCENWESIL